MTPALARHLDAVRHDLGKYVTLEQRALGPDPASDALRAALIRDLRATRSGPDGVVDAGTLWDALEPALRGRAPLEDGERVDLTGDPDLERLGAALAELRGAPLEQAGEDELRRLASLARTAADAARSLYARRRS